MAPIHVLQKDETQRYLTDQAEPIKSSYSMVVGGAIPAPRKACCVDSKVPGICILPSYNGPPSSRGFTD